MQKTNFKNKKKLFQGLAVVLFRWRQLSGELRNLHGNVFNQCEIGRTLALGTMVCRRVWFGACSDKARETPGKSAAIDRIRGTTPTVETVMCLGGRPGGTTAQRIRRGVVRTIL